MHVIQIYRMDSPLYQVKPSSDSNQVKKIMGENELRVNFTENQYIAFQIGDKANVLGEWYYLNQIPQMTKVSSVEYNYQMVLESTNKTLSKVQYLFLGSDNSLKEGDFSLTGKAIDFIKLIVQNAQRLMPYFDFSVGQVTDSDYKTLSFSTINCLDALAQIAEAFDTEYWIQGTKVSLSRLGRDTGLTFKHGRNKGLYEIVRQTVDNQPVITRLYAFGSDKNLPDNYRNFSKRLKLPSLGTKTITNLTWSVVDNGDNTETYTFNWDPPQIVDVTAVSAFYFPIGSTSGAIGLTTASYLSPRVYTLPKGEYYFFFRTDSPAGDLGEYYTPFIPVIPSTPQPAVPFAGEVIFIEKNTDKYGLNESTVIFDDIYPHRTGTVTAINAGNIFEFTDTGIDFNVNDYLLSGMTAKITFNTGQLSGYTFEIKSFDNAFKKFVILKNKNERVLDIPSLDLKPAIGDKYVITDIKMPQTYIDAAEAELQTAAQALLDTIAEPQLAYQLTFDPVYLKQNDFTLQIGDLIWIVDAQLGVNRKFRAVSTQRNLLNEFDYQVEVADTLRQPKIQALTTGQGSLNQSVSDINAVLQNSAILNNRVIGDLIMTDQSSIVFEDLQPGTGLTAIGIDANGKIFKM